jgi:hypothetical protein
MSSSIEEQQDNGIKLKVIGCRVTKMNFRIS